MGVLLGPGFLIVYVEYMLSMHRHTVSMHVTCTIMVQYTVASYVVFTTITTSDVCNFFSG